MSKLSNECYTPSEFIDPIREFAKGFDFDPFSSYTANLNVKALVYCDRNNSAYTFDNQSIWHNSESIWVNPPYSTKELLNSISHLLKFKEGKEIYLLLNTDNSTKAYNLALQHSTAILLVRNRLKFIRPYAEKSSKNNRPQTLFFFGTKERAIEFRQSLSHLGKILFTD